LAHCVQRLEDLFFGHRGLVLGAILLFTAIMAVFALQLRMSAGFEKQIPEGHEYTKTYEQYKSKLLGANRIEVVVKARTGTIWSPEGLSRLYAVTDAVMLLPNVDRGSVQSLWTPNTFVNEITEEGFRADAIIPESVTTDQLTPSIVERIRQSTIRGGDIGTLVSRDQSSAIVIAELNERDATGRSLDYVDFNKILEAKIRGPFEDDKYEIQIIGFAKQIGDIADGASGVAVFCVIALLLTALAVYWYCHSIRFTILPIFCSLCSLVWQFGTLRLLGFGLDPLAVLVPFLVFSIGVSHGIQQINYIVRELSLGRTSLEAARRSFSGLLVPGTLALVTALVAFITLLLIPILMVRELAMTAALGVTYKIVTNLVMLPVAASYFNFTKEYAERALLKREARAAWLRRLARVARPRNAYITVGLVACIFALAVWEGRGRVIGTLQPGAPELRPESRYNRDSVSIANSYDIGLDWLTVVFEESTPDGCRNPALGLFQDDFSAAVQRVPGVVSVASYSGMLKVFNEGYNEGNPKMFVVPIDPINYAGLSTEVFRGNRGYMTVDCGMTAVHAFLADHRATTINGLLDVVKRYRAEHALHSVAIRLAAGNAGVLAATNDEVSKSELPMMLYVYAAILLLVFLAYRDFRAMIACCLPLTVATFIGYWFMKELEIGLTVATLPVMVLAVGIGVDYAFYIYNRLQLHLSHGVAIETAVERSILEVGVATIFTAITLAIGVATWSFSPLKFQADMGKLLAFMFIVNLIMAMTALPALAVVLERLFPRAKAPKYTGSASH
jgi:predicted RND superfamily exporter protein